MIFPSEILSNLPSDLDFVKFYFGSSAVTSPRKSKRQNQKQKIGKKLLLKSHFGGHGTQCILDVLLGVVNYSVSLEAQVTSYKLAVSFFHF